MSTVLHSSLTGAELHDPEAHAASHADGGSDEVTLTTDQITGLAEYIRDTIATALTEGSNVTITVNDGADTITIAASGGGGGSALDDLDDVDAAAPNDGDVLTFDDGSGDWVPAAPSGGGASALDDLTDVVITSPAVGALLRFNGTNWVDADPRTTFSQFDDFNKGTTVSGNLGEFHWTFANGATTQQASEADHVGIVRRESSTTGNTAAYLTTPTNAIGFLDPTDDFDITWLIRQIENDSDTLLRIGLGSAWTTVTAPTNGIYFEKLPADTQWFGVARATSQTRSTAVANTSTNWDTLRMRRIDANTVGWSVNGGTEQTLVAPGVTTFPTAVMPLGLIISNNNQAANKRVDIDYCHVIVNNLSR